MSATGRSHAALGEDRPATEDRISLDLDIDGDDGVRLAMDQSSMGYDAPLGVSDYGSSIPNPFSGEEDFDLYNGNEDDAEMSSDGGVQLPPPTTLSAEQLNAEMDMVDAEIMGPYNLAAISTNHFFNPGMDTSDDDDDADHWDLDELQGDFDANSWNWLPNGVLHAGMNSLNLPNAMSEVSQQLQHIQEGQEQGELAGSAVLHAAAQDNSTDPILLDSFSAPLLESIHVLLDHFNPLIAPELNQTIMNAANVIQVEDQHNLSLSDFLYSWGVAATRSYSKKKRRGPHLSYLNELRESKPLEIRRSDLRGEECDFQGINWRKLEVSRIEARKMRMVTYKNYTNLNVPRSHSQALKRGSVPDYKSFFKFQRMDFKHKINLAHFQLRNLVAATSRYNIFYAGESRVYQANPRYGTRAVRMNLTNPEVQPIHSAWSGIQISTIAADHNILIAGGFCGEYAMTALDQPELRHTEGLILDDQNSITNHIQVQLNRQGGLPQAAIASNDCGLRILDCTTEKFVAHHIFENAVNCSALSPDRRLRAIVGDTRNVMICNAETGEILQELDGHVDFGFACAWADNGWHVATGNQDKMVKIWDARMWTDSWGAGKPLQTISAVMAGVRSLKFSPLGSGKPVLVAAEPADIISVIDADSYLSKQALDFYGEIAGVDFTPDGQELFLGIHDSMCGGLMGFERCLFGQDFELQRSHHRMNMNSEEIDFEVPKVTGLDRRYTADSIAFDNTGSNISDDHRHERSALLQDIDPF